MAVTASRLGAAPITVDWSNVARRFQPDSVVLGETWSSLKARFNSSDVGFYDAPVLPEISQVNESKTLAQKLLKQGFFTDCLFLGIGGSSLGPISLLSSLRDKTNNGIRFHFVENPDPTNWKFAIAHLKPQTTLVCSVTKSGTTFETLALTSLALDWLGKEKWKTHLVLITDPTRGDLRSFATDHGIQSLSIAPSIGGRFSIFSPVGLFPAFLAGLNVDAFLTGAKQVRDYSEKAPVEKNPLLVVGSELLSHYPKRSVHVFMPYCTHLKEISSWFVQLWGESLGKNGKGFTPLAALGTNDQHSILQLLRDGPDDKITFFVTVDKVEDDVRIPSSPLSHGNKPYPAFQILAGHSLQELLTIEQRAISLVLTKQSRPHISFRLDTLDERSVGALYFSLCILTAFTGTLWDINPFDQPGVEEGKIYIREALSQETDKPEENSAVSRLRRE